MGIVECDNRPMPSVIALFYVIAASLSSGNQGVDIKHLMNDIRADVAVQAPSFSFVKGGETGPGTGGDFFLTWRDGDKDLHVSCDQHSSPEEAIQRLRRLRMAISAGVPDSLPGVADEAYYLGLYRWHIYFARRQFVCQVGGPGEAPTRGVAAIVVKHIDSSVREKKN
jgi:hypothetical protein